jgi:hypothetical protein
LSFLCGLQKTLTVSLIEGGKGTWRAPTLFPHSLLVPDKIVGFSTNRSGRGSDPWRVSFIVSSGERRRVIRPVHTSRSQHHRFSSWESHPGFSSWSIHWKTQCGLQGIGDTSYSALALIVIHVARRPRGGPLIPWLEGYAGRTSLTSLTCMDLL